MQAVTLIYMAFTAKKPVLALGFGSLLSIYTISTQGGKFHVLNGPTGNRNPSKQLPQFDRFATEAGAYPSGWLDHGTGDMYCYKPSLNVWQPVCNVGIHRYPLKSPAYKPQLSSAIDKSLTPTTFIESKTSHPITSDTVPNHIITPNQTKPTSQPTKKKKESYASAALDEKILSIRKPMLQHPFLKDIEVQLSLQQHSFSASPLTLLLRTYPHWFINAESALPVNEGIQVLADCKEGPVILSKDNSLLLAIELERSRTCYPAAYHLIKTFIQYTFANMIPKHTPQSYSHYNSSHNNNSQINRPLSLYSLLFGTDNLERDSTYDTHKDRRPRSAPLSRTAVRSALPNGPTQVDPPNINMFFQAVNTVLFDPFALTAHRKHTSLGKVPRITVQNPLSVRHVRLQRLFEATGFIGSGSFVDESLASSDLSCPLSVQQDMPPDSRDLFAGRIMNSNNIAISRRSRLDDSNEKIVAQPVELGDEQQVDQLPENNNNQSNNDSEGQRAGGDHHSHYHQYNHNASNLATVEEEGEDDRVPDTWSSTEEIRSITPFTESVEAGSVLYESLELSSTAAGPTAGEMTSPSTDFPFPIMPMSGVPSIDIKVRGGRQVNTSTRYTMAEVVDKNGPFPTPPSTPRSSSTDTKSTSIDKNSINHPQQIQPDTHCVNSTAVKVLPAANSHGRTFITRMLNFKTTQHFLPIHHPHTATRKTPPPIALKKPENLFHGRNTSRKPVEFHPIAL